MVETLVKNPTSERLSQGGFGQERVVQMGQLAIKSEQLRINDPLTHLYQYLERGDESLVGIREDIETDIAERLPKTPFVNRVGFGFTGDDFVSVKDRVSMRSMTENNLQILATEQAKDSGLSAELARAKAEVQEVEKLSSWFKDAPVGEFIIFESLPIGKQKVAISRIYQKRDEHSLDGCFVSLYDPSVRVFNEFRKRMGANKSDAETELEILENQYKYHSGYSSLSLDQFIETYVGTYDTILDEGSGEKHKFGLNQDENTDINNGMLKVRSQPKLTSIYIDTVKSLSKGGGMVSHNLVQINEKLGLGFEFRLGDTVTAHVARNVMSEVIRGITSAIDRADVDLLFDIEQPDSSSGIGYAAVSHYGAEARSEGVSYESNACPEFSSSNQYGSTNTTNSTEFNMLLGAFNPMDIPNKFGRPKIDVCRINNCPTRGESKYVHRKTLVGGCDICVRCHKIFEKGKSPERVYNEKNKVEQQKQAEEDEGKRVEQEVLRKRRKQKIAKGKQQQMRNINKQKIDRKKPHFFDIEKKAA